MSAPLFRAAEPPRRRRPARRHRVPAECRTWANLAWSILGVIVLAAVASAISALFWGQ